MAFPIESDVFVALRKLWWNQCVCIYAEAS